MLKTLLASAALASCALAAPAFAGTADLTINLTATVAAECTFSTAQGQVVDFSKLLPRDAADPQNLSVSFTCSDALPYSVTATGANDNGGAGLDPHYLVNSTDATSKIAYQAYWGNDTSVQIPISGANIEQTGTGTATPVVQNIRFVVPAQSSDRKSGSYADTLTLHLNF